MKTAFQSFATLVFLIWVILATFATLLPLNPDLVMLDKILIKPGFAEWLGYDDLGRPIVDRLIMGARTSLTVALIVVTISILVGTSLGVLGAWLGGVFDKTMVMVIDLFIAFPGILLAIALAGLMGPGLMNAVFALSLVSWVGFARLARVQTLTVKQCDHVLAARALGTPVKRILIRHVLPLIMAPLIIEATFALAGVVIAEAGLSFLGLGVQPPAASWGNMIRNGTTYLLIAPHVVLAPGFAILSLIISINMLGDRLRDTLDIKEQGNMLK